MPFGPSQQTGRPKAAIAEELESHGGDGSRATTGGREAADLAARGSTTICAMPKLDRAPSQPLVTIVTPSFNQGEFIADAISDPLWLRR